MQVATDDSQITIREEDQLRIKCGARRQMDWVGGKTRSL
jgi:hypothetical protein